MIKLKQRNLSTRKKQLEEAGKVFRKNEKDFKISRKSGNRKAELIRAERQTKAQDIIKELSHGAHLYIIGKGGFSVIDLILALLKKAGPSNLDVSTWTIGPNDIHEVNNLVETGDILNSRWLLDQSMNRRESPRYALLLEIFGLQNVRLTLNHAKVFLIYNDNWHISLMSSANLNMNPRYEWYEIIDCPDFLKFTKSFFDEFFTK